MEFHQHYTVFFIYAFSRVIKIGKWIERALKGSAKGMRVREWRKVKEKGIVAGKPQKEGLKPC
jgi:hypothetical protein